MLYLLAVVMEKSESGSVFSFSSSVLFSFSFGLFLTSLDLCFFLDVFLGKRGGSFKACMAEREEVEVSERGRFTTTVRRGGKSSLRLICVDEGDMMRFYLHSIRFAFMEGFIPE